MIAKIRRRLSGEALKQRVEVTRAVGGAAGKVRFTSVRGCFSLVMNNEFGD